MAGVSENDVLLNPYLPRRGGAFKRQGRHWGSTPRNRIWALLKEPYGNRQKLCVLLPPDVHTVFTPSATLSSGMLQLCQQLQTILSQK